jgi:hypothetical protein
MSTWLDLCLQLAYGTLAGQVAGLWLKNLSLGPDGDRFVGGIGGVGGGQILQAMAISNSTTAELLWAVAQVVSSVGGGVMFIVLFGALADREYSDS